MILCLNVSSIYNNNALWSAYRYLYLLVKNILRFGLI